MSNPGYQKEKERSVLTGLLIGIATLIPFIYITWLANSVVLLAEAVRSGNETFAIFLSWISLRLIHKHPERFRNTEQKAVLVTGIIMLISAFIVIFIAYQRILEPKMISFTGGVLGMGAALFSATINGWLWQKNLHIARKSDSKIMKAQWILFRTKFLINICVLLTMLATIILKTYETIIFLDAVVSVLLAIFIVYSAFKILRKHDTHETR